MDGVLCAYLSAVLVNTPIMCPSGGCPATLATYLPAGLLAAAAALVVASVASFAGIRAAFLAGAILSGLVLALVLLQWAELGLPGSAFASFLSVLSLVADAAASRPRRTLSEQGHPLNLPVFG